MKKPGDRRMMAIDLGDEIEEADEEVSVAGKLNEAEKKIGTADNPICFSPILQKKAAMIETSAVSLGLGDVVRGEKGISRATGMDLDDPDVLATIMNDDMDCDLVDAVSQQAEVVDLSSSESGDEGDDYTHASFEMAEEQEEIITTLSREDAVIFADVMKVIKEGGDLRKFRVDQLKTYLRHHGMRIVGLKLDLLERINQHLSIKDGQAEQKYPRGSFSINCKGDVCLGDTVLFLQTVHDMPCDYGIGSTGGPPLGKRWVAGKVVSESYGAGKQQHTFTIEVMWSSGVQPFYCMRPLRIKGRNLYRMVTMRQPWSNEAERQKVLDEKHARGAAARAIRRAVKGLKSKGKSRADSRVRPHNPASPSTQPSLNSIPQGRNHPHSQQQQQDDHQGDSVRSARDPPPPSRVHPQDSSVQHGKRSFHSQQNGEREGDTNQPGRDHPGPPKRARLQQDAVQNGRRFHNQQQNEPPGHYHVDSSRYPPPPNRVHPQDSFTQRGERLFHSQPGWDHPGPPERARLQQDAVQNGRRFHDQEQNEHPRHYHVPPRRAHAQAESMEHGRVHSQRLVYHQSRSQGICTPCSNSQCEKAGAKQCITRSCASCCSRNSTSRGRCQRHR